MLNASRIIAYMESKKYNVDRGSGEINIVYVEGMDRDGDLNDDLPNCFNDLRLCIQFIGGKPSVIGAWEGSSEPGAYYTYHPMNRRGAARIAFGQYKAWRVGTHGNSNPHEALIQVAPVNVHRDLNKDFIRTGDALDRGLFGINQHWGYDLPDNNVEKASAGCLVGRTRKGHQEFMVLIKSDRRFKADRKYIFTTTIIAGDDLMK
ncbi:MAG: hypothetical protein ACRC2R_10865 [Xenococcaceae cyanobacterium]